MLDGAVTVACKGSAIAGREPPQRRKGVAGRAECSYLVEAAADLMGVAIETLYRNFLGVDL